MPFWLLVLIMVTLIALCWGSGWGWWSVAPGYRVGPGLLGILGLILLIVLVMIFVGGTGAVQGVH